jgi:uncharacterized protein YgbK (DUF1537 family)
MVIRRHALAAAILVVAGACSSTPKTDAQLAGTAQEAVDRKLGAQATFSLMETGIAQQVSCGHATTSTGERDFVYQRGRLIMDDDPDFDQAAIDCDTAAGGGNDVTEGNGV